jgi:hypothetical protein
MSETEAELKNIKFDPENITPEQQKQIDDVMNKYLMVDEQNQAEVVNKIESESN